MGMNCSDIITRKGKVHCKGSVRRSEEGSFKKELDTWYENVSRKLDQDIKEGFPNHRRMISWPNCKDNMRPQKLWARMMYSREKLTFRDICHRETYVLSSYPPALCCASRCCTVHIFSNSYKTLRSFIAVHFATARDNNNAVSCID